MNTERPEVQNIIWNIMKDISPIISEGGYKYFMLGGTLLGAIRHKGFIPWDDDIDIGMPREDYERFLKEAPSKLPEHLKVNTYRDESDHHYYFSRVVDTRHTIKRMGSAVSRTENVWIDIFPLDGMPNNSIARQFHKLRLLYCRTRYHVATFEKVNVKRPNRPIYEKMVIWFVSRTGWGTKSDPNKWLDKVDKCLKKYSVYDTNWVVNFMGQYIFKEMFPKAWYGEGKIYQFEDSEMMGPVNYDKVLTRMYGDYMTPPKNKNAHAAEFIE